MSVKYYTHFLLQERVAPAVADDLTRSADGMSEALSEFRGVVEVSRQLPRDDFREAAGVLARNFACNEKDIRILQWSRLH
jgi:hypothetical protein